MTTETKTLKQLLNQLIELGWKPRTIEADGVEVLDFYDGDLEKDKYEITVIDDEGKEYDLFTINDLCSIDSGLRQFVCEKGLYLLYNIDMEDSLYEYVGGDVSAYLLMLSSIQEDKEKFLLDNIILPSDK